MPGSPTRAPVPGAALPRLLARLGGSGTRLHARPPADLLGEWLDWQRAVALSRALDDVPAVDAPGTDGAALSPPPTAGPGRHPDDADADAAVAAESRAVRAALEAAIADDARDWTLPLYPRAGNDSHGAAAGAAAVQRHCQGLQRDAQAATGRLRGELRERLERRGGDAARLAAVDAVMEGMLAPREHALLAPVVPTLVARFEQLHAREDGDAPAASMAPGLHDVPARRAWRDRFRGEARQLLLAELDFRFHPIEALLAALRTSRPDA